MSTQTSAANSYDEIPFPCQPLPQTHPDRLATVATLFGMEPQPIDRARVLELGCGTGDNLIPMGDRHPDSTFVGIDYSLRQVAAGRATIEALGLKNVELMHLSITDIDESLGRFDYIICHGVFSWVTPELRDKILSVCRENLNPQGVAYLSYNTYPGWQARDTIRRLVCGCAGAEEPPRRRIDQARKVLEFFSTTLGSSIAPHAQLLKTEIDVLLRQPESYFFHEYFEEENNPLYFHEFVELAARHGLQYLGDTTPAAMFPANFGPTTEQNLLRMCGDTTSVEQHMDLLRNRPFRQTLVCHRNVRLERHLSAGSLARLFFVGKIRPESGTPNLHSVAPERFLTSGKAVITTPSPTVKAALWHLGSEWPRALSLAELLSAAAERLGTPGKPQSISPVERENLGHNLVQCLATGLVDLHCEADRFVTRVSDRPRGSWLARVQARTTANVTNRRHEPVRLNEVTQNVLPHLDGEHDRAALVKILADALASGRLSIFRNEIPISSGDAVSGILEDALEQSLSSLAASGLLIA